MEDLTKIDKKFGDLDIDTKLALNRAHYEGETIEYCMKTNWKVTKDPVFDKSFKYRVKPKPVIPHTIPWDLIHPNFNWFAVDEDGDAFFYDERPKQKDGYWHNVNSCAGAKVMLNVIPGNMPWDQSLVERPKKESDKWEL